MNKIILLPNNQAIDAHSIISVRCRDEWPEDTYLARSKCPPKVVIDYSQIDSHSMIILDCATTQERNALADRIIQEWKSAIDQLDK